MNKDDISTINIDEEIHKGLEKMTDVIRDRVIKEFRCEIIEELTIELKQKHSELKEEIKEELRKQLKLNN